MALLLRWRTNIDAPGKTARETTLVLGRLQVPTASVMAAAGLATPGGGLTQALGALALLYARVVKVASE
jgi:hypothetical protein